jgi:aryl sulfotransferase
MSVRASLTRYRSVAADSIRWDGFVFRDGDIVISSPMKCGTTWVQMICALLIFQQRTLPTSLDIISPWLDMLTRPLTDVVRDLDTQQHRRFLKSHTPLDGLPFDERVMYVCVGRDPRDVALSFQHHMANLDVNAFLVARQMAVGLDDFSEVPCERPPVRGGSLHERFWQWVDAAEDSPGLRATVHHLATFWEARECPNVVLLHYEDLQTDLEGQMRHLAARLGTDVPEASWCELVPAATFNDMRSRADEIVPNSNEALWCNNAAFFNKGTTGQWRQLIDEEDLHRYWERIIELADPELVAWMHHGAYPKRF